MIAWRDRINYGGRRNLGAVRAGLAFQPAARTTSNDVTVGVGYMS